jgi:hypothetical protein
MGSLAACVLFKAQAVSRNLTVAALEADAAGAYVDLFAVGRDRRMGLLLEAWSCALAWAATLEVFQIFALLRTQVRAWRRAAPYFAAHMAFVAGFTVVLAFFGVALFAVEHPGVEASTSLFPATARFGSLGQALITTLRAHLGTVAAPNAVVQDDGPGRFVPLWARELLYTVASATLLNYVLHSIFFAVLFEAYVEAHAERAATSVSKMGKETFSLSRLVRDVRAARQLRGARDLTDAMYREPEHLRVPPPLVPRDDAEPLPSDDDEIDDDVDDRWEESGTTDGLGGG